jgi:acyl-CoA thioester hydrolase
MAMKPPSIPMEKIVRLGPQCLRVTIPQSYVDSNGHMNMRWYVALFDDAGDSLHERLGLTRAFHAARGTGTMDLEHHTSFLNEVLPGQDVAVYARMVEHSRKMIHYLMFMINETSGKVAAHFECVNTLVDLKIRKTTPYPEDIARKIEQLVAEHKALDWPPPTCGAMKV